MLLVDHIEQKGIESRRRDRQVSEDRFEQRFEVGTGKAH